MAATTGRPGVFVSESLIPLTSTPDTPGQALAAFVGTHNSGPVGPTLLTSWADWRNRFGGFGTGSDLLPFSVYQFFANGGSQCYVIRAVPSDAAAATVTLNDVQATPDPVLTFTALSPGVSGNALYISITAKSPSNGRFDVTLRSGSTTSAPVEQWMDVSLNPSDPRNLIAMIGSGGSGSKLITATYEGPAAWSTDNTPGTQANTPLSGGVDGTAAVNLVDAAKRLDAVDDILNVNLPGVSDATVLNPLIAWAAASGSRFMVVDGPPASPGGIDDTFTAYKNMSPLGTSSGTPLTSSSYVAVYGPWLNFRDPSSQAVGATRLLPPGGAVLGLYSVADATDGVQQAAAGVEFPIRGALSPELRFANGDLDTLNQLQINVIRVIPGADGAVPMGARTLAGGMPDRYVPIRRTLMYLTRLCVRATNFAVFRPNNEDLWNQISSLLTDQLSILQQTGVLKGATAQDAFFVRCDATNNTENSVANGIVNVEVGVALKSPAEYIIIQIGQMASGATASDNLTS